LTPFVGVAEADEVRLGVAASLVAQGHELDRVLGDGAPYRKTAPRADARSRSAARISVIS
jgi:hypothetical protein